MAFIEVRPELNTGNKDIDAHHRHLIELFNSFLGAFRMRRHRDELGPLLDNLVDFATYHFCAEELWISACGYPEAEAHIEEHNSFIKRLTQMQKDYADGRAALSLEVLSFLSRWLKIHMYGADIRVARFEQKKGLKTKKAA